MPRADYDVAIVGGGMVGSALAALLARSDFKVALLDRRGSVERRDRPDGDPRVSAINPGSERMLTVAGAWDTIAKDRACPYLRMYVWDAGSGASIEFDSAELGVARLGTIVENDLVVHALHEKLLRAGSVSVTARAEPAALDRAADRVVLRLAGGESISARVLVGADGAGSWVREAMGIRCRARDFRQLGIVATVATEFGHRQTAWQRFLSTGPLAFLPLRDGRCSIVWSCEREPAERLMALDDERFTAELTRAFDSTLGRVVETGPRRSFALRSSHAERFIGGRTVLVGDAAHVVHPLAGQGVNIGFQDAAALAQVMRDARSRGRDIGAELTLRRYERWRRGETLAMYHAMNAMEALFGSDLGPVRGARGLGLRLVGAIAPLKSTLAYRAMGLAGDLPRIDG